MSHTEKDSNGLRIASKTNHVLDLTPQTHGGDGMRLFREALGEMGFTFISHQIRRSKGRPASVLYFQHSGCMDLTIVYCNEWLIDGVYTDGCRELVDKSPLPHQIRLFFRLNKNDGDDRYILTNSTSFLRPQHNNVKFPEVLDKVILFFRSSYVELTKNDL